MVILGVETSCDETALALIETEDNLVRVLANITHSQAALHAKYGGVFPNLAKREHSRNLVPLFKTVLVDAKFLKEKTPISPEIIRNTDRQIYSNVLQNIGIDLAREPELWERFEKFIPTIEKPPIDAIAVTFGPGLEPALWVGINFARALGVVWNVPVMPVNHMEGHIVSALLRRHDEFLISNLQFSNKSRAPKPKQTTNSKLKTSELTNFITYKLVTPVFPAVTLLISGGHTELVFVKKIGEYEIIGETKDDAVGEAFDKVARILGLPYPGGPHISALAEMSRTDADSTRLPAGEAGTIAEKIQRGSASSRRKSAGRFYEIKLPRPMLHSGDYNFSFSGLKTAVLYTVKKIPKLTEKIKVELAREFEDSVTEVIISKTTKAIKEFEAKTLIIAGGVIANKHIRSAFEELRASAFPTLELLIPEIPHSTDNALMIAVAGYLNLKSGKKPKKTPDLNIKAEGRLALS